VTKDELMKAVWPDSFVEESNLTQTIFMVRKALDETSDRRYILTIQGQGYRFLVPVTESEQNLSHLVEVVKLPTGTVESAPPSGDKIDGHRLDSPVFAPTTTTLPLRRRPYVAVSTLAVLACVLLGIGYVTYQRQLARTHPALAQRSLAILPLRNLRHDPDDDFLGFSLADAIITKLGPISSLTVRSSSAIEKYKGQSIDPAKVAAELDVDTLLTGTFIHDGEDLRITYQLTDAKTDKILGREMIDLKYDKLLTVQDKVTQQIIKGLELNLTPAEAHRIRPTERVNLLSYEYYLRGVDLVGSHDFPRAIEMLERAAELDPNYALTWAWLGQSYEAAAAFEFGGQEQYQKAQRAYERALSLEPKQLEASMFLANLFVDTGRAEEAVDMLRGALNSNPNYAALHWELGYAYRFGGMLKESVAECERARLIDPLVQANGSLINAYLYLGEYDKFLDSLPDQNDSSFIVFYRGFGEYHQKKWDLAARDFDRAYKLDPTLYTQIGKALSDSIGGKNSEGLEILHRVENRILQRRVGDAEATYKIAQAYAVLGDKVSALRMLRYSIEHGFFSYPYFMSDPLIEPIRSDPEFPPLMNIAYSRYAAFKSRFFSGGSER